MIKSNHSFSALIPFRNQEVSRILSAAVVNSHFRLLLLADPVSAISGGYSGESFSLSMTEKEKLGTIRASSLADFARQLTAV